jgi:hypothetical protein
LAPTLAEKRVPADASIGQVKEPERQDFCGPSM